jgi:hypothetical protein
MPVFAADIPSVRESAGSSSINRMRGGKSSSSDNSRRRNSSPNAVNAGMGSRASMAWKCLVFGKLPNRLSFLAA